jgi:hypothetical protein
MGQCFSVSDMADESQDTPKEDSSPPYIPLESLTEPTIRSIISVATSSDRPNWDYSERTLLIFLLAINEKLKEIESNTDEKTIAIAKQVRQWLVNVKNEPLDWNELQQKYDRIAKGKCHELAYYYGSNDEDPYFELRMKSVSYS